MRYEMRYRGGRSLVFIPPIRQDLESIFVMYLRPLSPADTFFPMNIVGGLCGCSVNLDLPANLAVLKKFAAGLDIVN
jgi:hypothetical protein